MSRRKRKPGSAPASVPVAALSIFDPIFLGIDEDGSPVNLELVYRNILVAGEPGAGKSVALNDVVAHAALCPDVRLVLIDGKQVELGLWRSIADVFVGNNIDQALRVLADLQGEMDRRYDLLAKSKRRKITKADGVVIMLVVDLCRARDYAEVRPSWLSVA